MSSDGGDGRRSPIPPMRTPEMGSKRPRRPQEDSVTREVCASSESQKQEPQASSCTVINEPQASSCTVIDEPQASPCTENDVAYFRAYANVAVHEGMLKDRVRTEAYLTAVSHFRDAIAGKVVLDVGCGTGILAIFCAHAGASRVYAVDASEIAIQADEIVKVNNLSNKVIVLHGRIEDVVIKEKVDVIISEWMGYMLLHESMLSSVIFARNKWFNQGGIILPSHAMLFMAPFTHPGRYLETIDFWKDVHGINMSPMLTIAKQCAFLGPCIETIQKSNLLAIAQLVMEVDCYTVTTQDLEHITKEFKFISASKAPLHGFAFWFTVTFEGPKSPPPILLSTEPHDDPTHWKQTLIYLFDPIELEHNQMIEGSVTLSPSMANPRSWSISIKFTVGERTMVKVALMK